jgi:hypothetical protein
VAPDRRPDYLRQVTGLARTWKAELAASSGGPANWPYYPRPAPEDLLAGPRERLVKAAAGIGFPLAAYRAGVVLDRADVAAIAQIPVRTVLVQIDDRRYLLRSHLDPMSDSYLTPGATLGDNALALASWYAYGCVDPSLARDLDPILFGINRRFYRQHNGALLGMAQRLDLEHDPASCRPHDRLADLGPSARPPWR